MGAWIQWQSLAVLFFCVWSIVHAQSSSDQLLNRDACLHPYLPSTIGRLSDAQEVHLHSIYRVNFTRENEYMSFSLQVESQTRFYVAPHDVDVNIYLYSADDTDTVLAASANPATAESILIKLGPGNYVLRLEFFGFQKEHAGEWECMAVMLEMAFAPISFLVDAAAELECPEEENLPAEDLLTDIEFSNNSKYWMRGYVPPVQSPSSIVLARIPFVVPAPDVSAQTLWRIRVEIAVPFLVGGSLSAMVVRDNAQNLGPEQCTTVNGCSPGVRMRLNEVVVLTSLTEGSYYVVLYQQTMWNDPLGTMVECSSFTFSTEVEVVTESDNPVNCPLERLPESLNAPGYLTPEGYLYLNEQVHLDTSQGTSLYHVSFEISEDSVLRLYIPEHARVDIDVALYDIADASHGIAYSSSYGLSPEGIWISLEEGNYYLDFSIFGVYSYRFCEAFGVEMEIAPKSMFARAFESQYCPRANVEAIDDITETLMNTAEYKLDINADEYAFIQTDYTQSLGNVWRSLFNLERTSLVNAEIQYSFLLGDLEMVLVRSDDLSKIPVYHSHGIDRVEAVLPPGQYILAVQTGVTQFHEVPHQFMPACLKYRMGIHISPTSREVPLCSIPSPMTKEISLAAFGGGAMDWIQYNDVIVSAAGVSGNRTSEVFEFEIIVPQRMLVRASSLGERIATFLYLYEVTDSGRTVRRLAFGSGSVPTVLEYEVEEDTTYILSVGWNILSDWKAGYCVRVPFDLTARPLLAPGAECTDTDPPLDAFDSLEVPWMYSDQFKMMRRYVPSYFTRGFTVDSVALIRFELLYDTSVGDMSIVLLHAPSGDIVDLNEVGIGALYPGAYHFQVHMSGTPTEGLQQCVPYTLRIHVEPVVDLSSGALLGCPYFPPPALVDSAAYLSPLSGRTTHIRQPMKASITQRYDDIRLELEVESLVHAHVPPYLDMDIDLKIGIVDDELAEISWEVSSVRDTGEAEHIIAMLNPGTYVVRFLYYGAHVGYALPSPSSCPVFVGEVSVVSNGDIRFSNSSHCEHRVVPQASYISPQLPHIDDRFVLGQQLDPASMQFTLTSPMVLYVDLEYLFFKELLEMRLHCGNEEGNQHTEEMYPIGAPNHWFYETLLDAGDCVLSISENHASTYGTIPSQFMQCGAFGLVMSLESPSGSDDSTPCERTSFPHDLYSSIGGSAAFGGPQDERGRVRVSGRFLVPVHEPGLTWFVRFQVPEHLYMRVYAVEDAAQPAIDIDFFVWDNVAPDVSTDVPMYAAVGGDNSYESALWSLEPSDEESIFTLGVKFARVGASVLECRYFQLEIELRPSDATEEQVLCPAPFPVPSVPPPSFSLGGTRPLQVYGSSYAFRGEDYGNPENIEVIGGKEYFRYRITLSVAVSRAILSAFVEYNFLVSDFSLRLTYRETGGVLRSGVTSIVQNGDNGMDMKSEVLVQVPRGTYDLDILDMKQRAPLPFEEFCHRFGFGISISYATNNTYLVDVSPPGGNAFNPFEDFELSMQFSDQICFPASDDLVSLIHQRQTVGFIPLTTPGAPLVAPYRAAYGDGQTSVKFIFAASSLSDGVTYMLQVEDEFFRDCDGNAVDVLGHTDVVDHLYAFRLCDCGGRGHCIDSVSGSQPVCECDPPFVGDHCDACPAGMHFAGDTCEFDAECEPDTCNHHGHCVEQYGSVRCWCDEGYATIGDNWCGTCANGFMGYPTCTKVPEAVTEGVLCTAALLPSDLNTVALLDYDGTLHVLDDYYVDTEYSSHEIQFQLQEDSVMRVHVGASDVNVDLYLYELNGEGDRIGSSLAHSVSYPAGEEESLYELLEGAGRRYQIVFAYSSHASAGTHGCNTIPVELAIVPLAKLHDDFVNSVERNAHAELGTSLGTYADEPFCTAWASSPSNVNNRLGSSSYSYSFASESPVVVASQGLLVSSGGAEKYFFHVTVDIANDFPEGVRPVIEAVVDTQFVFGDVGLMLERRTDNHCGSDTPLIHHNCVGDRREFNRHHLHSAVQPGRTYTVWVYLVAPINADVAFCSPFEFTMTVRSESEPETQWSCPEDRLPDNFNSVEYKRQGSIHFIESYFIPRSANVQFTVEETSDLRLSLFTEGNVDAEVIHSGMLFLGAREQSQVGQVGRLFTPHAESGDSYPFIALTTDAFEIQRELSPANYTLRLSHWVDELNVEERFCHAISMEMALSPVRNRPTCGQPSDHIPPILTPIVAPYTFGILGESAGRPLQYNVMLQLAETVSDDRFAPNPFMGYFIAGEYPLSPGNAKLLSYSSSSFLYAHVQLVLFRVGEDSKLVLEEVGRDRYNLNHLEYAMGWNSNSATSLYVLFTLVREPISGIVDGSCVLYELAIAYGDPNSATHACIGAGEPLPRTLNGLRFIDGEGQNGKASYGGIFRSEYTGQSRSWSHVTSVNTIHTPLLLRVHFQAGLIDGNIRLVVLNRDDPHSHSVVPVVVGEGVRSSVGGVEVALVADIDPGKQYRIVFDFFVTDAQVPLCAPVQVQFAIAPIVPLAPRCTPLGESHWISHMDVHPLGDVDTFLYDSQNVDGHGGVEALYVQQRAVSPRSHFNTFQMVDPFNIRVDLGYDFLNGDFSVALEDVTHGNWIVGWKTVDRSVLHATNLPSSTYRLHIYETTVNSISVLGCANFTIRLLLEKYEYSRFISDGMVYPMLPLSLNSISGLSFNDRATVRGVYRLLRAGALSTSIAVTLRENSVIRVSIHPMDPDGSRQSKVQVSIRNASEDVSERNHLVAIVSRDASAIVMERGEWGRSIAEDLTVYIVIEVDTVANVEPRLAAEDHLSGSQLEECVSGTSSAWPEEGTFSPGIPFIFHDELVVDADTQTNLHTIAQLQFRALADAYVYAYVGSRFLEDQLTLHLQSSSGDMVFAAMPRNHGAEIYQLLPAGSYDVTLKQLATPIVTTGDLFGHCIGYDVTIFIANEQYRYDCKRAYLLPRDFNTEDGMSKQFGGPMLEDGSLFAYGDHFLLPSTEQHAVGGRDSVIGVRFQHPSVVAVYSRSAEGLIGHDLQRVTADHGVTSFSLTHEYRASGAHLSHYFVEASASSAIDALLQLSFPVAEASTGACPYYTLSVISVGVDDESRFTPCESAIPPAQTTIEVDEYGFASFWKSSTLSSSLFGLEFVYVIDLSEQQFSQLHVSVAFDALSSISSITVTPDSSMTEEFYSHLNAQPKGMNNHNHQRTNMISTASARVRSDVYRVKVLTSPIEHFSEREYCAPFTLNIEVTPEGNPSIVSVDPPGSRGIPQQDDLSLTLTFSTRPFYNTVPVDGGNTGPMYQFVYVFAITEVEKETAPCVASPLNEAMTIWNVRFCQGSLEGDVTYRLALRAGHLTDSSGLAVTLTGEHDYYVEGDCDGEHQHLDESTHLCICDVGFKPPTCEECLPGYGGDDCGPGTLDCPQCVHGVCDRGTLTCECDQNWTGSLCDQCERGWSGLDCQECAPGFLPPLCDECEPRFAGRDCDRCSDRFTGADCDECVEPFTGPSCSSCIFPFSGPTCSDCVNGFDPASNCSTCAPHFTGESCDHCAAHFTGRRCSDCVEPFTGENCDECRFPFAGPECSDCVGHRVGALCDVCALGWSGDACDVCAPRFTGPDCTECKHPFTGDHCLQCEFPFTGPRCDECVVGWDPDSGCTECSFNFQGDLCDECAPHFAGSKCSACASRFTGDDCSECVAPFTGQNCTECLGHFVGINCEECAVGWDGDNCDTCADRFTGMDCESCVFPFDGPKCEQCLFPFAGENCAQCQYGYDPATLCSDCLSHFVGDNCDECAPHFTGSKCSTCTERFTGDECDECVFPFAGDSCSSCVGHFTGPSCDHCARGWSGDSCDECAENFIGDECSECLPQFTGLECKQCAKGYAGEPDCNVCASNFRGENCDQCANGWTGPECDVCGEHWTGEDCDECAFPFTGAECSKCDGHFTGSKCDRCELGWAGDACDECAPHFGGVGCLSCLDGWSGRQCDVCAKGWAGEECDRCDEYYAAPTCQTCVPSRAGVNCTECEYHWTGSDCLECAVGFMGDDCLTVVPSSPNSATSDWTTAFFYLKVIGIALGCTTLVLALAFVVYWVFKKQESPTRYRPVVDLDDGTEMDSNLVNWDFESQFDTTIRDEEPDAEEIDPHNPL